MGLDSAIDHLLAAKRISAASQSYAKDNPGEWAKVKAYLEGGARPTGVTTEMGLGLIEVEDARRNVTPDPDPGPGPSYPASYYAGPLGQGNILPGKTGAFLMVWGPGEYGQATTWAQFKANILQRESDMTRKYDGIMTVEVDGENRLEWIRDHDSIPITHFGSGYTMAQIASGQVDGQIDARAVKWASVGVPLIVRPFHEFNLPHTTYSVQTAGATTWISAWRRFVDRVHAIAPEVGFWWCPTEGDDRSLTDAAYPGDQYVDWVGTDTYNWQMVGGAGWATPLHPGWATFAECFDYQPPTTFPSRHNLYGPRKPFMVGETGTKYDPASPASKPAWYRAIPSALRNMQYCHGVAFFDQDVSPSEPGNNWLVKHPLSNPDCLQGFIDMSRDPIFNTR